MSDATKMKSLLLGGACLAVFVAASPAFAQSAAGEVEEVVVTGSRIQSGFQTPTPVTSAAAADLRIAAPSNLADGLNQLPVFNGSTKLSYPTTTNQPGAASGQNLLSMRGLGANRNLILLDGRRMPATNGGGSVDVNIMPQSLVSRVDVVTGGASAAYGSDAVAGVVNFILDTKFEGLKGEIQGGISTYGDLPSFGGSLAYGRSFAEGRGRFIASAEYFQQRGKGVDDDTGREWYERAPAVVPKPVGMAGPARIVAPDVVSSVASYGGLITAGPLKGTQFLAGGATAPFNYGALTGAAYQSGGDGARANVGLMPDLDRYSGFAHGEYDFSRHATLFVEGLYSHSHTTSDAFYLQTAGTSNQYTIFRENAYLPAAIRNQMTTLNLASFTMGRFERDLPPVENESFLDVYRGSLGLKGAIGGSWTYDASLTRGRTIQDLRENDLSIARPLYAAADAVVNPANGQIVCRSTLSGLDPGCTPRNLFGEQPMNDAVNNYVLGDSIQVLTIDQTVWSANVNGDLGDSVRLAAGPIALAAGVEYRKESAKQVVDAISASIIDLTGIRGFPAAQQGKLGPFRHNNPQALAGSYDIKEAYLEVGLPVLKDQAFARSLDLNGAVRYADYSTFGGVTTWKAGANWQVVDDLRLRLTRSRDIRGGNILELFNAESQITNNTIYRGVSTATLNIASGNPRLKPEVAATLTYGAVYRPSWFRGFQISLDYYKITIKDAIGSIGGQRLIDECNAGNTALCGFISPPTATSPLILRNPSTNLDVAATAGYDLEAAYATQFAGGALSFRVLGNHVIRDYTKSPGSPLNQQLGSPTSPKYRVSLQIRYAKDAWSLFWQTRYQAKAKLSPNLIEGVDISAGDNAIPDIAYSDFGGTYDVKTFGRTQTLFFSITNLMNQKPPTSPPQTTTFSRGANTAYDPVGRYFTAGLRFKF